MQAKHWRRFGLVLVAGLIAAPLAACGGDDDTSADPGNGGSNNAPSETVVLGYFPNLTHASAIVGDEKGFFADALAQDNASVKIANFDSGSDTIDALLSGSLDATYIGPSPAITAYAQSQGAVRIVSGFTLGGASLLVIKEFKTIKDLKG
jgi:NitT/TauT family transport system substrate-binding protein